MQTDARTRLAPLVALSMGLAACSPATSQYAPAAVVRGGEHPYAVPGAAKLALLLPQFVRQQTPTSCSVASIATVLNAALAATHKPTITQQALVATDRTGAWTRSTERATAPGVTLDQLALFAMQAFYGQGLRRIAVDVVHIPKVDESTRQALETVLEKNNLGSPDYFVVVNFLQSVYSDAGDPVGHMSVVAHYDASAARVLVLDVDQDIPSPYWVPFATFLQGMATADDETGEPRGYLVIREPHR